MQQIEHHLNHPVLIGENLRQMFRDLVDQLHSPAFRHVTEHIQDPRRNALHGKRPRLKAQRIFPQAHRVQQVVQQERHAPPHVHNGFQLLGALRMQRWFLPLQNRLRQVKHTVQRIAQLMRRIGEELVLQLVRPLQLCRHFFRIGMNLEVVFKPNGDKAGHAKDKIERVEDRLDPQGQLNAPPNQIAGEGRYGQKQQQLVFGFS
ncbi:hypothetical protein D1872_214870 [compost metagenome]